MCQKPLNANKRKREREGPPPLSLYPLALPPEKKHIKRLHSTLTPLDVCKSQQVHFVCHCMTLYHEFVSVMNIYVSFFPMLKIKINPQKKIKQKKAIKTSFNVTHAKGHMHSVNHNDENAELHLVTLQKSCENRIILSITYSRKYTTKSCNKLQIRATKS